MDNGYGRLIQQAMINIRYKGGRVQEQDTAISTDDDPVVQLADGLMEQALTSILVPLKKNDVLPS